MKPLEKATRNLSILLKQKLKPEHDLLILESQEILLDMLYS
jgi:hypothetical protein